MANVRVLVLRAAGINCDEEIMHCWRLAGAQPDLIHVNRLAKEPAMLRDYRIVTLPGGFSYGDDIAAGVILAQQLNLDLGSALREHVERGGGLLGVCNGFQVLVKAGLLPGSEWQNQVSVTYNDRARFEARWTRLQVCTEHCPFLTPGSTIELPIEHAEGKLVTASDTVLREIESRGQVALRYIDESGNPARYPANPSGSQGGVAGLCDSTGRIFGLMPHPDRYFDRTHHPQWTSRPANQTPDGLTVFLNAVRHWQ